ncbi:complement factor H-like [Engraulis encrasicolus]|uniref:complement factor H-like n=1 Tax=Engraulis encrasicolus TaxID=184585 RepID=UPI002FD3D96A
MANLYHITIYFAHFVFLLPCSRAAVVAQPCTQPPLDNGFLHPVEQQPGRPGMMNYRCDKGFKPITGGWWGTITCEQGKWNHDPLCIDSSACTPPQVSNGRIGDRLGKEHYRNEEYVLINCNEGYVLQGSYVQCRKGKWEPLPVCQRNPNSCSAPPERPNAIIKADYKDIFNHGVGVQYLCMDKYKMNGPSYSDCYQGKWTEAGECVPVTQDVGGGHNEERNAPDRDAGASQGGGAGQRCPEPPSIHHGDIVTVSSDKNTVTYQCANYYKINGTAKITCRNGHWSTTPSCEANYCKVEGKVEYLMPLASAKFINGGGEETFHCEDRSSYYYRTAVGTCENGRVTFRGCGRYYAWTISSAE